MHPLLHPIPSSITVSLSLSLTSVWKQYSVLAAQECSLFLPALSRSPDTHHNPLNPSGQSNLNPSIVKHTHWLTKRVQWAVHEPQITVPCCYSHHLWCFLLHVGVSCSATFAEMCCMCLVYSIQEKKTIDISYIIHQFIQFFCRNLTITVISVAPKSWWWPWHHVISSCSVLLSPLGGAKSKTSVLCQKIINAVCLWYQTAHRLSATAAICYFLLWLLAGEKWPL